MKLSTIVMVGALSLAQVRGDCPEDSRSVLDTNGEWIGCLLDLPCDGKAQQLCEEREGRFTRNQRGCNCLFRPQSDAADTTSETAQRHREGCDNDTAQRCVERFLYMGCPDDVPEAFSKYCATVEHCIPEDKCAAIRKEKEADEADENHDKPPCATDCQVVEDDGKVVACKKAIACDKKNKIMCTKKGGKVYKENGRCVCLTPPWGGKGREGDHHSHERHEGEGGHTHKAHAQRYEGGHQSKYERHEGGHEGHHQRHEGRDHDDDERHEGGHESHHERHEGRDHDDDERHEGGHESHHERHEGHDHDGNNGDCSGVVKRCEEKMATLEQRCRAEIGRVEDKAREIVEKKVEVVEKECKAKFEGLEKKCKAKIEGVEKQAREVVKQEVERVEKKAREVLKIEVEKVEKRAKEAVKIEMEEVEKKCAAKIKELEEKAKAAIGSMEKELGVCKEKVMRVEEEEKKAVHVEEEEKKRVERLKDELAECRRHHHEQARPVRLRTGPQGISCLTHSAGGGVTVAKCDHHLEPDAQVFRMERAPAGVLSEPGLGGKRHPLSLETFHEAPMPGLKAPEVAVIGVELGDFYLLSKDDLCLSLSGGLEECGVATKLTVTQMPCGRVTLSSGRECLTGELSTTPLNVQTAKKVLNQWRIEPAF